MATSGRPCTNKCGKTGCTLRCPICVKSDLPSAYYCSNDCFKAHFKAHKHAHNYVSGEVDKERTKATLDFVRDAASKQNKTPRSDGSEAVPNRKWNASDSSTWEAWARNCGVILETPRLILRPVYLKDNRSIFLIKSEPMVAKWQLYDAVKSEREARQHFTETYLMMRIPLPSPLRVNYGLSSFRWAITIKPDLVSQLGNLPEGVTLKRPDFPHGADIYIGNVGVDVTLAKGDYFTQHLHLSDRLKVKTARSFVWPHPEHIADSCARAFYEIHPLYWRQGIVTEALTSVIDFMLCEYGAAEFTTDPIIGNDASDAIARKIPGMGYVRNENSGTADHKIFCVTRDDWVRLHGLPDFVIPEQGRDGGMAGKEICVWCLNLRTGRATMECDLCGIAKYCSVDCKDAHWDWPGWGMIKGSHRSTCRGNLHADAKRKGKEKSTR